MQEALAPAGIRKGDDSAPVALHPSQSEPPTPAAMLQQMTQPLHPSHLAPTTPAATRPQTAQPRPPSIPATRRSPRRRGRRLPMPTRLTHWQQFIVSHPPAACHCCTVDPPAAAPSRVPKGWEPNSLSGLVQYTAGSARRSSPPPPHPPDPTVLGLADRMWDAKQEQH